MAVNCANSTITTVAFGELEPALRFGNSKAVYLSALGNQNIEVRVTNIPRVKVIVSKIYESNLLAAQRYGYSPKDARGESGGDEEYYDGDYENSDVSFGDVIYEQEIDTRSLPKYGSSRLFTFNVEEPPAISKAFIISRYGRPPIIG